MADISKTSLECSQRLTELLEFTCHPEFMDEMVVAREVFSLVAGKVNDDDFGYEQRMQLFQEFFLFEHRLCDPSPGYTIYELFLERAMITRTTAEVCAFEHFRSAYRSLFVVERSLGDEVEVRDLLGANVQIVRPLCSFSLGGLPVGQVFEGRLLRFKDSSFFTGAFIFHAPAVKSLIVRVAQSFLARIEKPTRQAPEAELGSKLDSASASASASESEFGHGQYQAWVDFLRRRFKILRGLQNKRDAMEQASKKRAIDHLALARSFANIYQMVSRPDGVTALGSREHVSCFVPENPVVQRTSLLNALALCEVRCMRYKHIEPEKVYAQVLASDAEGAWGVQPERSLPAAESAAQTAPESMRSIG